MWKTVNEHISQAIHYDFKHTYKRQLQSTNTDKLYQLTDGKHNYLVKIALKSELDRLESEAIGLKQLTQNSVFMVPDCIVTGANIEFSFIVLEWLVLDKQPHTHWHDMGKQLAMLHQKHDQAMFGFDVDNYLATTVQPNQWHKKWDLFYAEERIGWQLQLLAEKGIQLVEPELLINLVREQLHSHIVEPSLVHGDFWRGNMGFIKNVPTLFNPACYYGDREVDIAMSELFAPLPDDFYNAYNAQYPLSENYKKRKAIYQLYPILNHANIFAGHYLTQAKQHIDELLSL
ncbi:MULTISPECIES: fructosamine kinase family protein [unclassified Pseudoalteromonas]|uniref:fructosamine kinase family protein n=1 Tax=unclassified Pseudoalteromonas TaxID=194690 RepID=UPI002359F0CE|nr:MULTISPECIES: fructosamine kinase family protein [unclassified Pseudoalteromonas]MDC9563173.1 fructosamine kinase family protein [Pseudoalteromonas sp. GAB2316C]MDC9567467.1 fructosamine kinase family protein [Pseudoalteromonas sp. GABNB9D]MDC9571835.1 fructosamine kinase family protein [Pseudoalteromonas sp. GABNS16A]MDC9576147.1 fructosamine kinase family protein [Pseudoalteromonas sp. GABNS16E]MDC9583620.1 fructosamine kinase family protein [Pseudoalteromonas sp. GABNS16C]